MAQIQYASSTFAPKTMYSRSLTLTFTSGLAGVMTIAFDSAGGGTYTLTSYPPGTVTSYDWTQEPYRGWLWPVYFSGFYPLTAQLNFNSITSGTFSGTLYYTIPFSVAGSFSLTP